MVVGFGLINKDCVAVVPEWERDQKVRATHYFEQVGGPVPVALTAIARFGGLACTHLGVVGADAEADFLASALREASVTPVLQRAENIATSRSLVLLDARDGSRTLANYAEALPSFIFTEAHLKQLQSAQLLHLDARDLENSLAAATIVKQNHGLVSLDLGTMRPGREALWPLCDLILASRGGGAGAFPDVASDPKEQVRRFLAAGASVAGVTLAEKGVVLATREKPEPQFLPAFIPQRVVDTCGAGDLFHGAFCWAYLKHRDAFAAAEFAQAAVALRVGHYGNQAGLPTRDAVEALVNSIGT
jgi:sulfofructose kinase